MWENQVGRSRAFCGIFLPEAQSTFRDALGDVSLETFLLANNDVRPSLIRTESDEVTYNLHILIRSNWNSRSSRRIASERSARCLACQIIGEYLGIQSPYRCRRRAARRALGSGAFGYFPTYSLGNSLRRPISSRKPARLGKSAGHVPPRRVHAAREWLRNEHHSQGRRYPAAELGRRVTGGPLSHDALMRHLRGKFAPLYDL